MEKNINKILQDIYAVDPSLKAHEASLIKIVENLLFFKPESKVDESFISELRIRLTDEARRLEKGNSRINFFSFSDFFGIPPVFKRTAFAGAGLIVLLLAVFVGLKNLRTPENSLENFAINGFEIKEVEKNAFGEIVFSPQTSALENQTGQEKSAPQPLSAVGMDGGGGISRSEYASTESSSFIVPPFELTNLNYVYKGGDFEVNNSNDQVYRASVNSTLGGNLARVVSSMNLNIVDLAKFGSLKVNNLEISEDKDFGYSIYIDLRQNNFSINMNWEKWPQNRENFPVQQIPDEQIIAISDQFLTNYGIDMKNYGKGEIVKNQYGILYAEKIESMPQREPIIENVSVVYPLVIGGQTVFEQGGQKYGLTVSLDLRYKKVTGAYNINSGNFESSKYDIETNSEKIIELAEGGGLYLNYRYPEATKTQEIDLGTPTQGLVVIWRTEEGKINSTQLLVPAMFFPMNSKDDWRNFIAVPLVGGMVESRSEVIPLMETGTMIVK